MSVESPLRDRLAAEDRLIETFRWEPAQGAIRWPAHRARLLGSAKALGFRVPGDLDRHVEVIQADAPLRVRLTLGREGDLECTTQPFHPQVADTVWRVAIAETRLGSRDLLLRHKTTRRDVYAAARAEAPAKLIDEMLLLNERGELCEGTITSVFLEGPDGSLLTPALESGLLPGILRAELLRKGMAREAVFNAAELAAAPRIFVGNSLRGLIPAALVANPGGNLSARQGLL